MKLPKNIFLLLTIAILFSCKNEKSNPEVAVSKGTNITEVTKTSVLVKPITHGSLVLETEDETIYVDPTGGLEAFKGQKSPTLVLITDIHGDHLNIETLKALNLEKATLIAPSAVTAKLPKDISKTIVI